jgi:hypothetical protein
MGISVAVNPPKTPVTEGSGDVAPSSLPGVYKMPGPPAPFVPTPLPNIGRSSDNLDCTKTVKIGGKKVANKGTTFKSTGSPDAASKGTGGGIVSSTEEGKTEFAAPGSMNTKMEGKNVQQLGDAMTNNDKDGGATLPGNIQAAAKLLGVSEHDAKIICDAFCQAQREHLDPKNKQVKGSGSASKRFQELLEKNKSPGMRTEQSFLMPKGELLTRSLFNSTARSLAGTRPFNFVSGLVGAAGGAAGQSVTAAAGIRLSRALAKSGLGSGLVRRPDLLIVRGGKTQVFDAKFKFASGGKDKWQKGQKRAYRNIGRPKKNPKEINGKVCGC